MLRRFQGSKKSLPTDIYAVPDSPEKPIVTLTRPEDPASSFSPLRGEDKKRQPDGGKAPQKAKTLGQPKERRSSKKQLSATDAGVEKQQSPNQTPRRSPRKLVSEGVPSGISSPSKAVRSTRSISTKHQDLPAGDVEEQDADANDDGLAANEPVAGLPEEGEVIDAANSHASPQTPQKRGRGRPPRSKKKSGPRPPRKEEAPTSRSQSAKSSTVPGENATNKHASQSDPPSPADEGEEVTKIVRPIVPRVSQIPFPATGTKDALDDTVMDEETEIQQEQKKKRAPPGSSKHSSNARKRAKRSPARGTHTTQQPETSERHEGESQVEIECNGEAVEEIDKLRLFGQGWRLDEIYNDLSQVGQSHRNGHVYLAIIDRNDKDVRLIHRLCKQDRNKLKQLENRMEASQSLAEPPEEFGDIELGVQRLCDSNVKDESKASEIYFHTIPALVRLLKDTIKTYEKIDGNNDTMKKIETITIDHLRTVINLIAIILKMGDGALEYDRPDSTLAVVKPVKHNILKPLKEVHVNFLGYLKQSEQDRAQAKRKAIERSQRARDEQQEQIEREQREHDNQVRAEWLHLHDERRYVEPFGPAEKLWHLRMPDPPIECDQNDEQYVRVELFKRRIGPHPVYIKHALDQVWSEEEIAALEHGLREFAGPRVFQDIFRAHCGRKGALSKYNVTEIVTTAADMKDHLAAEQMEEYGEVEDWVKDIPVWVNIPTSLGQENTSTE